MQNLVIMVAIYTFIYIVRCNLDIKQFNCWLFKWYIREWFAFKDSNYPENETLAVCLLHTNLFPHIFFCLTCIVCVCVRVFHSICMKFKRQLAVISSLFLPCDFLVLNSCSWAWWQASLVDYSLSPTCVFLKTWSVFCLLIMTQL